MEMVPSEPNASKNAANQSIILTKETLGETFPLFPHVFDIMSSYKKINCITKHDLSLDWKWNVKWINGYYPTMICIIIN